MKKIIRTILPLLPIFIIVAVGAYLRLHDISLYMTFLGDEGRDVLIVRRMITEGKWTLLGPTASVGGFFMGPIYYYFMLPFLWLWNFNPVGPAIMVAMFGILTIFLVYYFGNQLFGRPVGLIASLLYAVSPVIISYSRSSWNPNIVPFFSLLLFYLLWRVVENPSWKQTFWIGVILGIGLQLHYTFVSIFGIVAFWYILYRRLIPLIKYILMTGVGFVVGFSPFLAFEVRHSFMNIRSIVSFIFEGKDTGFSLRTFTSNIIDVYFRLYGRLLLRLPEKGALGNLPPLEKITLIDSTWVLAIAGCLLIIGFYFFRKKIAPTLLTKISEPKLFGIAMQLLTLWICVTLLFFGFYKKTIYDYYFGIMYFVPFVVIGLLYKYAYFKGNMFRIVGSICIGALFIYNWQGRPFRFEPNNQLGQVESIAKAIIDQSDGKPFNFALISGGNSDHAYRYFFDLWGRTPVTIENTVLDPERKSVTDQLLIVCEDITCQPLGNSLWEVAGFGRAEIAKEWYFSVVKLYKLVPYKEQI